MRLFGGKYIPNNSIFGIDEVVLPKHKRNFYLKHWYKAAMQNPKNKGRTYADFVAATAKIDIKFLHTLWVNSINAKYSKPYLMYR
ncbi:MAG: hypothetical protein LBB53_01505 [Prevotellaceae bacterium]|jgi:hypothetical protein|nr:hypothetical protein [Prevotellaceae bacterium]